MELHEYEMKFVEGVHSTYEMLKELDEVDSDIEFWRVYAAIDASFTELEDARTNYYAILKNDGGDTEDCSLTHELRSGLYLLDEKYIAIWDKIAEVSALPN